ncbi:MAG: hypothetical protein OXP74_06780 [Acidobacteriota bacterium]|nr:hypothetical protein [Acidobacteriota bacterium]
MAHTAPGVVNVDGSSKADVVIHLTMSDATAAKIVHAATARLPESAPAPTLEQAVLMALTWARQDVRSPV